MKILIIIFIIIIFLIILLKIESKKNEYFSNKSWNLVNWNNVNNYHDFILEFNKINDKFSCNLMDKIWVYRWLKSNDILGPLVIAYTYGIENILDNLYLDEYCVKPSHLADSIGIFLVKNGVLLKDINYTYYTYKLKNNKYIGFTKLNVPKHFYYKKGHKISKKQIYEVMMFLKNYQIDKPNKFNNNKICSSGYLVEKLHSGKEIKIFIYSGKIVRYYLLPAKPNIIKNCLLDISSYLNIYHIFDLKKAFHLALTTAKKSGSKYGRYDIIDADGKYRISEITLNPSGINTNIHYIDKNLSNLVHYEFL